MDRLSTREVELLRKLLKTKNNDLSRKLVQENLKPIMYHFPGRSYDTVAEYAKKLSLQRNKNISKPKSHNLKISQEIQLREESSEKEDKSNKNEALMNEENEDSIIVKIDLSVIELD